LLLDGHIQADVARILNISQESVRKHKVLMVKAGILREIPGTKIFERGPRAKIFEKAARMHRKAHESTPNARNAEKGPNDVHRPSVKPYQEYSTPEKPNRAEVYDIPTFNAHVHGTIIYEVESLGYTDHVDVRRDDGTYVKIPLFDGEDNLDHNNNHRWNCTLHIPGQPWTVSLQLRTTERVTQLFIYPPRKEVIEEEIDECRERPGEIFADEIETILNFFEKWGRWRFKRADGQRVGRVAGEVYYALRDSDLAKHLPMGMTKFEGLEGVHIDHSKGEGEVESNTSQIDRVYHMLRSKEHYEELMGYIEQLKAENRVLELRLEEELRENLRRFKRNEEEIGRLLDLSHMGNFVLSKIGRSVVARTEPESDNGGMYQ